MKGRGGRTRLTSPPEGEVGAKRRVRGEAPRPGVAPPPPPRPSPIEGEGEGLVLLGEFGRAHGLKGEVRLKSFTDDPRAIATYGPLVGDDGRRFALKNPRPAPGGAPDMLVIQVEGVTTREAAEALNRTRLYVAREKLPPAEEDEFLLADLIGLPVVTTSGETLGQVVGVPNYGGGDLLEIAPAAGGATALLPFTKAFVPEVDVAAKRIVADPPADLFAPPGTPDEP
jgi:16S rRNA processing protein RimM